jgi:4-hydroxyphenylpyruvate dioxygenase-like putative hemolysin
MSGFRDQSGLLKILLNESESDDCRPGACYLRSRHNLSGVRRIAFTSPRIVDASRYYKSRGVDFEIVPACYYDSIARRLDYVADFRGKLPEVRDASLFVAEDYGGLVYQGVIRSPYRRRDGVGFELIYRDGAFGFGTGSQFALWEAEQVELAAMEAVLRSS